jgi:hypothetical protein
MRERRFDYPKRSIDVSFHGPVKLLGSYIKYRFVRLLPTGVIHQNIETAKPLHCLCYQLLAK